MNSLYFRIELLSDTLIGSGEGWGAHIDSDVVFDEMGLPFIPGRRVKGCLKESAIEVAEMFEYSKIDTNFIKDMEILFGRPGQSKSGYLSFSNCYLKDYHVTRNWMDYLMSSFPDFFSNDIILSTFSNLRQQTSIEEKKGIAKEHSLRTSRVLQKGSTFYGTIEPVIELDEQSLSLLAFASTNFRYMGTKRNRGFGSIQCTLMNEIGESLEEKYLVLLENQIMGPQE